jgi:O-Antigen ligase
VTLYVRGRQRFALSGAILASFLFACFLFGALSVRNPRGLALIGVMFCVAVYRIKPQLMVWVALFSAFATMPAGLHTGMVFGPVSIWAYHVALVLAICYLIPIVRPRLSAYLLPGMFLFIVVYFAVVGFVTGNNVKSVLYEGTYLFEVIGGFILGLLVVYSDYVKGTMHALAVMLWFSAGMVVAGSLHVVTLEGRTEHVRGGEGGCAGMAECAGAAAFRVITTAEAPAIAVLTVLVAASIVGRVRPAIYFALGPPALVISVLAFARITLIEIAVAAVVTFVASLGWSSLRRTAVFTVVGAVLLAVMVPGSLFLLQHSPAGDWLGDQFTGFNNRVLGGISSDTLAVGSKDESALARLAEDANLHRAIAEAPVFGHGLGFAYQLPFGRAGSFTAGLGTTYSHNFYLWWLAKAGAVGMLAFALFAITPVIRALRCATPPAKISAAVCVGLLAVCIVEPMPEEHGALTLGLALGSAMAFASRGRTERSGAEQTPARSGAEQTPARSGAEQTPTPTGAAE